MLVFTYPDYFCIPFYIHKFIKKYITDILWLHDVVFIVLKAAFLKSCPELSLFNVFDKS